MITDNIILNECYPIIHLKEYTYLVIFRLGIPITEFFNILCVCISGVYTTKLSQRFLLIIIYQMMLVEPGGGENAWLVRLVSARLP